MFRLILIFPVVLICQSTPGHRAPIKEVPDTLYAVSDNCSSLPVNLRKAKCHPLSFYVKSVSEYFTNNTMMHFTAGKHQLPSPTTASAPVVNVTGISKFSMIGIGVVNYNMTEEGAPLPSSIISCNYSNRTQPRNGILFYKTSVIHIENLTIENCGAMFTVRRPDNFKLVSALTYRESYDVTLIQVRIDSSLGFGLDADRIFGSFRVSKSAFVRSEAYRLKLHKNIGGNARFWYSNFHAPVTIQNTSLEIHNSWFMYGCLDHHMGYSFASGLIIFIYIPSVKVTIDKIIVKHNIGKHGGNMAIQVTDFQVNTSSIAISNSIVVNGSAKRGGGLQFWIDFQYHYSPQSVNLTDYIVMNVINTNFTENSAEESGGGVYIGHYTSETKGFTVCHVSFKGCYFSQNSVHDRNGVKRNNSGAAVQVIRYNIDDFIPRSVLQYSTDFKYCVFENNQVVGNEGGILDFVSTHSITITDCTFSFNVGTAISLRQSNIKFLGFNNTFKGNRGIHGGAMKFCELSKMYLPNNDVQIEFIENSANWSGGAIYVSQQVCLETASPCFFQPIGQRHKNTSIDSLNIKLRFHNNTAELAGDAVYGGQVDDCLLFYSGEYSASMSISQKVFNHIFDLTEQRTSSSKVASHPFGACFYDNVKDKLECHNKTYPINGVLYPGQTFSIHVAAVGQMNGTSPVSSELFHFEQSKSDLHGSQSEMICHGVSNQRKHYTSLNCIVYSNQPSATFSLTIQQVSHAEVTQKYAHYSIFYLTVRLGECPWGFKLSGKMPNYKCVCDSLLNKYGILCNINTQYVTRWHSYWLGCTNNYYHQNTSANNEVESDTSREPTIKCKGLSLAVGCVLGYCSTERRSISPLTLDNQCSDGREGVLCGRCKQNYTLSLGTSQCLASCPTYMVYIIVVSSAAIGILLILLLTACNFTISEGTMNGLLFYAHVIHKNVNLFFPDSTGTSNTNVFRLFIAWLNLDSGFDVCFYKSMTQYQKVWLEFGFLFYIWFLQFLIILLSRKYIFFTRLVGRNVVKVLATLGLVCFPKLLNIALGSIEFAYIQHSDGHRTTVWQLDGNLKYLSDKHIALFMLGIALSLLATAYTLALLFIQCLQKQSRLFFFGWVDRLRPFFEAHTGPCHVHYRFWPGCLFFARLVLFTLCSLLINKDNLRLFSIITACVVIQITAFVLPNRVYKRWPLNVLETTFFVNLGAISGLTAIFGHTTLYFVYPSVSITMALFAGILLYHSAKQLRSYPCCQKLILHAIMGTQRLKFKMQRERHEQQETEPFLHQGMQDVDHFRHHCEMLIEDQ